MSVTGFDGTGFPDAGPEWFDAVRAAVLRVHLTRGGGSAFGWEAAPDGTRLLTNQHVVAGQTTVEVEDARGGRFAARVLAADPALDLALLHVDAALPVLPRGDSAALRLGELVFALGHPWGRAWTITRGVVSGVGRVRFGEREADLVRSDVRLAPGNSGGPLLNAAGEAIGVNSMVWGGGLGVAVPVHVAATWAAGAAGRGRSAA